MKNLVVARKLAMALTGLFLCFFLLIHFAGNLQLFLPMPKAQEYFNHYSEILSTNILISAVAYVLYISLLAHLVISIILTVGGKKSGGHYQTDRRGRASKWYSRNMFFLGTVVLFFLIVHLGNFWYKVKFGNIPTDPYGREDLYSVVVGVFHQWWFVVIYIVGIIALCYHLIHGLFSAVRTLGLFHPKYVRIVKCVSIGYSVFICIGFILMPLYIFLKK